MEAQLKNHKSTPDDSALSASARIARTVNPGLAGIALLALGQAPAFAATINVGGGCTLVDAVTSANTDAGTGGCTDGAGADTLVLPSGGTQTLTDVNNADNGLPVITSAITIQGNGSTIRRAATAPPFRIFDVAAGAGRLTLQQTTVTGGSAGIGGGLLNSGIAVLTNSTLDGNRSTGFGAGVSNRPNATLTIINSTLSGNIAGSEGGGIDNEGGTSTFINSTVSGNSAGTQGGGVSNFSTTGTVSLILSTVTDNSAPTRGGGVGNIGELNLRGTLISGNAGTLLGREVFHSTGSVVANFNLFGFNGNSGIVGFLPGANNVVPPAGVTILEILGALASNAPGTTQTHALIAGSPALNTVTTGCPPPALDQRGVTRPQGTACDVGSFELEATAPPPPPGPPGPPSADGLCFGLVATITGTELDDTLIGTPGPDVINGLGGDDEIFGRGGNDRMCGGAGNDTLIGARGADRMDGGEDTDECNGGIGPDTAINCEAVLSVP